MQMPIDRILGVSAAGASSAPAQWYGSVSGDFLVTHGVFGLSCAEWIQIIGAVYVATLLTKMLCGWIKRRFG